MRGARYWRILVVSVLMASVVVATAPEAAVADSGTDPVTAPNVCSSGSSGGPNFVYDPFTGDTVWGKLTLGAGDEITVTSVHRKNSAVNGNWSGRLSLNAVNADGTPGVGLSSTTYSMSYYWAEHFDDPATTEYPGPTRSYVNSSGSAMEILVSASKIATVSIASDEGARTEADFSVTDAGGNVQATVVPDTGSVGSFWAWYSDSGRVYYSELDYVPCGAWWSGGSD